MRVAGRTKDGEEIWIDIDLDKCESEPRCAHDHTCRIHKLLGLLNRLGMVTGERLDEKIERSRRA